MRLRAALAVLILSAVLPCATSELAAAQAKGALTSYDFAAAPASRVELPAELSEISGLAYTGDSRLLAQGDESAVIWEIGWPRGRLVKRFGIGGESGPRRGDFEDIQVVGGRIYLVTSSGQLVVGQEGSDGQTTPVLGATRGLKAGCEVEGMSWDAGSKAMLLLCKTVHSRRWKNQVVVLAVSPETGRFEAEPRLAVPEKELHRVTGQKGFAGSALVRHPRTGTYILLAGHQRAIAEVDSTGTVLGGAPLAAGRHRQPEGIAIASDGTLLISDEAAGKAATITGYASRR